MKKFLSLVLALVMTMSLVTVSAGAKDFTDSDELSGVVYEEAVNVMSEMGIIDGYSDGDFRPQGTLTRGAAAKIIACMMLGKTTAEALGTQAAPFKDVPAGSTFAGYIAYCVEAGLIDGYADGTFRPSGTLTGFAFLKMLLTSLGYDSSIEGYTGTNWTVNVASRATQIGLTDGNDEFVGTRAATREEACLYAVNTLKATLVEYENKGQEITVSDGTVINVRPSAPTYVTSNIAGAATSIDDTWDNTTHDYTVEFAEKYQPDLELDGTTDAFGRPSHTWTWKNDEIGTYVDYDKMVAEYTTKVTGRDLYDALGKSALDACEDHIYIYVDGETEDDILSAGSGDAYFTENQIARSYTDTVGETGNGVLTQVFHDTRNDEITIAIINTYLAVAKDDYDDRDDELELEVYSLVNAGTKSNPAYVKDTTITSNEAETEDMTVSGEDFAITEYVEDDIVLVTVADGEIQTIADPEVLDSVTISNFKRTSYVTSDGTQYDYADSVSYDPEVLDEYDDSNMKNLTYNLILDPYGYMIGIELNEDPDQYLFLTGIDLGSSNLSKRNADANVIFTSGEMDTVTVDMRDSEYYDDVKNEWKDLADKTTDTTDPNGNNAVTRAQLNSWFTYTVDSNGVYTLKEVPTDFDVAKEDVAQSAMNASDGTDGKITIDQRNVSLNGVGSAKVYGTDNTIYIVVENDDDLENITDKLGNNVRIIDDVSSVVTGVKNANLTATNVESDGVYRKFANEVYTLFDEDGHVIAAVVVGEDAGVSTNYAYITSSDVNREADNTDDDTYTWTREAVVNGELVTLTEVGSHLKWIGASDMDQGEWYEVKYDADGNVRSAKWIDFDEDHNKTPGDGNRLEDEFATDVKELNDKLATGKNLMETYDTIVLADDTTVEKLTFKDGTLWTNTLQTEGFAVAADVKTVLVLSSKENRNGSYSTFDSVETGYEGYDGLRDALDDMNAVPSYGGVRNVVEVHAIIEDGAATSIIINDMAPADTVDSAATPIVTVDNETVFEGEDAVFEADVTNAADCGTLTYQWYRVVNNVDNDVNKETDDVRVGTGATLTIADTTTSMNGQQYYCVVTNTDKRDQITGRDTSVGPSNAAKLTVNPVEVTVIITYELSDGTFVDEATVPVNKPATGSVVTVTGTQISANAPDDFTAPAADRTVRFGSDNVGELTVVVTRATATLSLPTGVTASWNAGLGYTADSGKTGTFDVPAGALVTLSGTLGKYDSMGKAVVKEYTLDAGETKTVADTDVGYYKVTLTKDTSLDGYELSKSEFLLKQGESSTFQLTTTTVVGSDWTSAGLDAISGLTLTKGTPFGGADGNDNIEYTVKLDTAADVVNGVLSGDWA